MSKSRNPSEKAIAGWIKRGLGQGNGINYRPLFFVRDIPSEGRSTIVEGLKIKRTHHYLSDIEYAYHVLSEFSDSVSEIREQYALPREETQEIAQMLGVQHPIYSETGILRIQTSDLVLTLNNDNEPTLHVLCCKTASDIDPNNPEAVRTLEKILIENIYWKRHNVPWTLATDAMIPKNKFQNLDFFRATLLAKELDHLLPRMPEFLDLFRQNWTPFLTLNEMLHIIAEHMKLEIDHGFNLLGRALWTKLLKFDLNASTFAHEHPMPQLLNECGA
jgi:hypothetical protein